MDAVVCPRTLHGGSIVALSSCGTALAQEQAVVAWRTHANSDARQSSVAIPAALGKLVCDVHRCIAVHDDLFASRSTSVLRTKMAILGR